MRLFSSMQFRWKSNSSTNKRGVVKIKQTLRKFLINERDKLYKDWKEIYTKSETEQLSVYESDKLMITIAKLELLDEIFTICNTRNKF